MKIYLLLIITMISCLDRPEPSRVSYSTPETRQEERDKQRKAKADKNKKQIEKIERARRIKKEKFEKAKKDEWSRITNTARINYKDIERIIKRKCTDCHDQHKKLPFYGRIFGRRNFVYRHQRDGLRGLDFSQKFPLQTSSGYRPRPAVDVTVETTAGEQISYLKAIKESLIRRTMPLRSYTLIYRKRKIFNSDELAIVNWIDPIIADLENFQVNYEQKETNNTLGRVKAIFEAKCFRCHANQNNRGGFSGMEDLAKLTKSAFVNKQNPEASELYQQVLTGKMPTRMSERLTNEELGYVLDWIRESSR